MTDQENLESDILSHLEPNIEEDDVVGRSILIGHSLVIEKLRRMLRLVARNDSTVLLHGETGSGKEAAANYIYAHYHDKGRLVVIDCAALSDSMAEAELFGHAKGAFTGAVTDRVGLFHQAQDGIAFFDEVGEIPFHLQPKFLRLTEEKTVRPVGANVSSKVKVKIVAGTNKDLAREVTEGKFRQDLHARLNVIALRMPSLKEHVEDIPELVNHFLGRFIEPISISQGALDFLATYDWPDNVRQLRSAIERAVTFCQNRPNGIPTLERMDFLFLLGENIENSSVFVLPVETKSPPSMKEIKKAAGEKAEQEHLTEMFIKHHGNAKKIAQVSGWCYKAIRNKIKKYGLRDIPVVKISAAEKNLNERQRFQEVMSTVGSVDEVIAILGCTRQELLMCAREYGLTDMLKKLVSKGDEK